MIFSEEHSQIQKLLTNAYVQRESSNIYIIASTKESTANCRDYKYHSVTTSYLSRAEMDELVISFRRFSNYLQVYTDIELFLLDYYNKKLRVPPTLIFETSAKGIGRGRDALIPALCDIWNIRHLGPVASANIICSSKYQWTSILRGNGLPVPNSYFFHHGKWVNCPPLDVKMILKINYECASIGLSRDSVMINDGENITEKANELYEDYNQPVIAQEYIDGYEVEVPVLINRQFRLVLPPVGLSTGMQKYYSDEFFDYDAIYSDEYAPYDFYNFNPKLGRELMLCAYKIIDCLDLDGFMRIDFRVNSNGKFFAFDINNDPCISTCGSFLKSLNILGFDSEDIAGVIIGNALT